MFRTRPKLLLIENQQQEAEQITGHLNQWFDISQTSANDDWFDQVLTGKPDLIILDTQKSAIKSTEVVSQITSNISTQDTHIILYANKLPYDKPCNPHLHYLDKPISKDLLIAQAQIALDHFKTEQDSLEELEDFLNNAAVCVHCCDHAGRIIWANKTELDLLGYKAEEYIGQTVTKFHADKIGIYNMLYRLANDETLTNCEAQLKCKNGDIKQVLINSNVYRVNGEFMYTRCFTKDITEQKKVEEQLRLSEGNTIILQKNKQKFFYKVSHELRTPMNAVLGYSNRLEKMFKQDQAPDHYLDTLSHIKKGGRHLLDLINDILDISKAEEIGLELHTESLKLNRVAKEAFQQLATLAEEKGLEYQYEDLTTNVFIEGDPKRIRQIITNLIANAIKYTLKGSVKISVDYIPDSDMGEAAIIEVLDTGIGIKGQDVDKIFQSYGKVSSNETKHIEGTGLGLAITEELVRLHNGYIDVKSVHGKGSSFKVFLPTTLYSKALLNEVEKDAIAELFNIGIGQVGNVLSQITKNSVYLDIPEIRFVPQKDISKEFNLDIDQGNLDVVVESFQGDISGKALLLFPQAVTARLVQIMTRTDSDYDPNDPLHKDALLELGQIVINACFSSISNVLNCQSSPELPYHLNGEYAKIFKLVYGKHPGSGLLMLKMSFSIMDSEDLAGDLTFVMNFRSMLHFKTKIQEMLSTNMNKQGN